LLLKIKTLNHANTLNKPIDRRRFLSGSLVTGAALGASSMMSTNLMAMPAKKGGTLRVGFTQGATSDSTDPATFNNDFMFTYAYGVFNNLTEIAPDGSLVPELALRWDATPDAKTWLFELRQGVSFHDGKELAATDVIASIEIQR